MILNVVPEKCTGCLACEVACSLAHEGKIVPYLSRIRIRRSESRSVFLPAVCPPCDEKVCLQVCPEEGAIQLTAEGAVIIDEALCTGCSKCIRACPLGAVFFHSVPGRGKHGKAVALKCDQCGDDPLCVKVCTMGALVAESDSTRLALKDVEGLNTLRKKVEESWEYTGSSHPRRSR